MAQGWESEAVSTVATSAGCSSVSGDVGVGARLVLKRCRLMSFSLIIDFQLPHLELMISTCYPETRSALLCSCDRARIFAI